MRRYVLTIQLYLLLFMLPLNTLAAPSVKTRNIYYMVSGDSAESIWTDIMSKSPVKNNGRTHVAYTKWDVSWQFWWRKKTDACEITRVTTTLDVAYTLPRLKATTSMPDALLSQWEEYNAALFDHEQGHKDLGLQAAIEIENTIAQMAPHDTCKQLEQAANQTAKAVITKYSLAEKEYDRSTNHGLNTGAVFP